MNNIITLLTILIIAGCGRTSVDGKSLQNRENELLIQCVSGYASVDGRKYFLTPLAFDSWGESTTLPSFGSDVYAELHKKGILVYPADGASINDGTVIDIKTNKREWMIWCHIRKISDTEYEVDRGVWSCPLGGGGSKQIYKYKEGEWIVISRGETWVS